MKKLCIFLIIMASFFTFQIYPLYASEMTDYICELGLEYYRQGRYQEAIHEFKKALLYTPNYKPALEYIAMVENARKGETKPQKAIPPAYKPVAQTTAGAIREILDLIEIQREMIMERQLLAEEQVVIILPAAAGPTVGIPQEKKKEIAPLKTLKLDQPLAGITQPLELEQGKSLVIFGKNIQRFLVTQPETVTVEKKDPDRLVVNAKDYGYTYVHVWDDNGRQTVELLVVPPKPEGPSYEEVRRLAGTRERTFKLRYLLDWSSYESGRRLDSLRRLSYSWSHNLTLNGPSPYGDIDAHVAVRRYNQKTDLTYFTFGLTNGKFPPFEGFSLRGFDYSPFFSNLSFPGATLRGVMFTSPAFEKKIDYTLFWGREGGGRYGNLSPNLAKNKNSFLAGLNLDYSPTKKQDYKFSVLRGWGRDRGDILNEYSYDLSARWNFDQWGYLDRWGLGYELAYDSEKPAQILNANFSLPTFNFNAELRDIDKNFYSILGKGWRSGEFGGLFNLNYKPIKNLSLTSNLNIYRDRLYPAEDNKKVWNEDLNLDIKYDIDDDTSMNLTYSLQNDLGKISRYRYQSPGAGITKNFRFFKDISTYLYYYHQESKNFSSPSSDYVNDRLYAGLRFSLIGQLYYYFSREYNWLQEKFTDSFSRPNVWDTGVDFSSRLFESPFYSSFRFSYRDEEDADSSLSFLSGEDYIEGYAELSYHRSEDHELYASCRVRNVWAENSNTAKRIETSFNAGMRYLWDTGLRWESIGHIEGYVFRDLNSDGLRQRDDPPVEGAKIWLGKDKFIVTDLFGYYRFKGVRASRAYVSIDVSTIPRGFVLTVPMGQEVLIAHNRSVRVDFGIISRSEVTGLVFEDVDGDGAYSKGDKGVSQVTVVLENGQKTVTDHNGRYTFPNVTTGEHTISLDLQSLPVYYLPSVSVKKDFMLFDGVSYIYNIPLKRIKQ